MSDMTQVLDKNIDRLVDAISSMGPQANYALEETLLATSMQGWVFIIISPIMVISFVWLFVYFFRRGLRAECWGDAEIAPVVLPGIALVFAVGIFAVGIGPNLVRAVHPLGYLILQTIR